MKENYSRLFLVAVTNCTGCIISEAMCQSAVSIFQLDNQRRRYCISGEKAFFTRNARLSVVGIAAFTGTGKVNRYRDAHMCLVGAEHLLE